MRWLLWKDYRHNRLIVFAGLFFLLVPHLVALCATCHAKVYGPPVPSRWKMNFSVSSAYSLAICQLAVALIGGNAIAGERVDRSAEFLASLPITRRRLLVSKLLVALAITAILWLNAPLLLYLVTTSEFSPNEIDFERGLINIAVTGLTFFSVGWFFSAFLASPTFAVVGALAVPLVVILGLDYGDYLFEWHLNDRNIELLELLYRTICLTLAPVCFAVGTWHYLRRVEP